MTSLVAGTATAPISAFHFNTVAQYGLLANLLAIPAMGMVVMPAAVVAVLAAPFGLDWLPFQIAGLGMGYIIAVAALRRRARRRGDRGAGRAAGEPRADPGRRDHGRCSGSGGRAGRRWRRRRSGLLLWAGHDRPDVLIADNGRLFGILTPAGRVLSSDQGQRLCRRELAARTTGTWRPRPRRMRAGAAGAAEAPDRGRGAGDREARLCRARKDAAGAARALRRGGDPDRAELARRGRTGACLFVGRERLRRDGALAIRPDAGRAGGGGGAVGQPRPALDTRPAERRRRGDGRSACGGGGGAAGSRSAEGSVRDRTGHCQCLPRSSWLGAAGKWLDSGLPLFNRRLTVDAGARGPTGDAATVSRCG